MLLCKHGLSLHACTHCQKVTTVYATEEGAVYHSREDCPALRSGQRFASDQGSVTTSITSSTLVEAADEGRRVCKSCW